MQPRFTPAVLILFAAAGCHRPGDVNRQTVAQSLKGILVYPHSQLVSMSSGDSAGQLTLSSAAAPDTVANWFRGMLTANHWTLQSDARQPDGSIRMYAERGRRPLWISIQETSGAPGTSYTVTGAIVGSVDSSAAGSPADTAQRSGSSMSSKRIQR